MYDNRTSERKMRTYKDTITSGQSKWLVTYRRIGFDKFIVLQTKLYDNRTDTLSKG